MLHISPDKSSTFLVYFNSLLSGNRPGINVLESNLRGQSSSSSRTHIRTLPERVYVVDQAEMYLIVIVCGQYKGVSAREKVCKVDQDGKLIKNGKAFAVPL
jgi:hypothetical protein